MSSPTPKRANKSRKVKAWAVIAPDIWKKDGTIFNLMFNAHFEMFTHAIFTDEVFAKRFADRMSKIASQLIVPCTIQYTLPAHSPRRTTKSKLPPKDH